MCSTLFPSLKQALRARGFGAHRVQVLPSRNEESPVMHRPLSSRFWTTAAVLAALLGTSLHSAAQSPATAALITGKIDHLQVDNPNDVWSAGQIVVGGQVVILPRNLLIDLPANR